ncbi:hypothetical protein OKA06_06600 [Novosphingobium sp. MW5]|nr:hypothetical protein [Novosphingobium sp. MW5]
MRTAGALKAGLALGALLALQGCVAVAIPVVAGAAVAKKGIDGPSKGTRQADASAPAPEVRKAVFVGEEAPKANLAPTVVTETVVVPAAPAPSAPKVYTVVDLPPSALSASAAEATLVTKGAPAPAPAPQPAPKPVELAPAPVEAKLAREPAPAPAPVSELVATPAPRASSSSARVVLPAEPAPLAGRSAGYLGLTSYALSRASSPWPMPCST